MKNIVILLSDQQRWDSLGCAGQKLPTTPNLDRVAREEGVMFENAFSMHPICGPARACLQTGLYATQTGCFMNEIALPTDAPTLATRLNAQGYDTAYIGKWHLANTEPQYAAPDKRPGQREPFECVRELVPPERRGGWKYWRAVNVMERSSHGYGGWLGNEAMEELPFPENRFRTDAITDTALEFLRARAPGDKPFCLFVSYLEPHWQNDLRAHECPKGLEAQFQDYEIPADLRDYDGKASWMKDGFFAEYPKYLAAVHNLDENFGRVMHLLAERGLKEDTVVLYTSDHGTHFGHRNPGGKDTCHEASIHVPLLACGGPFRGGRRVDALVSLLDVPATVLDLAGIPVPPEFGGQSLARLVGDAREPWREAVFFQLNPSVLGRGIRTRRWKYAVRAPGADGFMQMDSDLYEEDFLYDLEADPGERNNLVANPEFEPVRAALREELLRRMEQAGERRPIIQPRG